jgi:hypothetical protein
MLVILFGMVTLVRAAQERNASFPMVTTVRPLVVLGMITAPPEPVYDVMVIVPLLVVKVNWASAANGKTSVQRQAIQRSLNWRAPD